MTTTLKLKGGTTAQNAAYTGSAREVTVDTQQNILVVHDGVTAGGFPMLPGVGDVTLTGTQTLTNKTLTAPVITGDTQLNGSVRGAVVAVAALNIDCSTGNYFTKTIAGASEFTFSNAPTGSYAFTLELTHTSGAVTWPLTVKWPGDTAPTLTEGNTHIFIFVTDDGGTRWRGAALVDYVN